MPENDTIVGGAGNDRITANVGDDSIDGGIGDDYISTSIGDDIAYGGDGNDSIGGNVGADTLYGDGGNDEITGGAGDDYIEGGTGNDDLRGDNAGSTSSTVGNDTLDGGTGTDTLYGGYGDDSLEGGAGDDTIFGHSGLDTLSGGADDDLLDGGSDADINTGGEGFDTFIAGDQDTITDFNTGAGQNFNNGNMGAGTGQDDNDFVDLSSYYNWANLATYNSSLPAGADTYATPLEWMQADQDEDGILNEAGITLTIQNGGYAVSGSDLTWDNTNVVCFGADALIRTATGDVPAGELTVGDLVETRDAGLQAIRWIGVRTLDAARLTRDPNLRPIRIRKGALGTGLPEADLIVSPQHRILVRSRIAQRMFGAMEVLVAARQLCQIEGIDIADDIESVTYVHFLFDAHQIVLANGAEAESLFTGAEALKSVGPAASAEIFAIFPELAVPGYDPVAVRELASGRMGRKLVVRHVQNRKPLLA